MKMSQMEAMMKRLMERLAKQAVHVPADIPA